MMYANLKFMIYFNRRGGYKTAAESEQRSFINVTGGGR